MPRVGYLGPEGTFSEEALLSGAAPDSVEPVPHASIYDTVVALREGDLEWAIVPIENSLDGSISVTLDLLADEAGDVQIVGETLLTVRHSLIAARAVELSEIDTVLTHPQVPGQCARFLRGELAHARVLPASSTAEAVREVVEDARPGRAALGTRLAAEIYGGTVLREGVQDRDDNETRFVWLARAGEGAPRRRRRAEPTAMAVTAGRRAAVEDLAGVLGSRGGQSRLAGALPGRVRPPRDQPDQDRVPATARTPRALHVLRGPRRRRGGRAERERRRGRRARDVRGGACARVLSGGVRRQRADGSIDTLRRAVDTTVPPVSLRSVSLSEHQRRGPDSGRVLVLNATFEPINVCSVRRAVVLLLKDKAELLERGGWELHSENATLARPVVIRLVSYVHVPRDAHRRKITRRAVFARDGWTCQYCGSHSNLTVDHVIPRSKGGTSSWENIVASCAPCNRRKGDRLPKQAEMHPRHAPRTPRAEIFIHVASPTIPAAWLAVPAAGGLKSEGRPRPGRPSHATLTGKTETA